MKVLRICGWLLLASSLSHCLTGVFSGEFQYPSMRAVWLTVMSAGCLLISITIFIVLAAVRRAGSK